MLAHEFTNEEGEVLVLRFSNRDGTAHHGFQHPMTVGESVTAPDWNSTPECGGGIHGWPWGHAIGSGKEPDYRDGLWQVYGVRPADITPLDGKIKFRTGVLRYYGEWAGAFQLILPGRIALCQLNSDSAASATGYRGAASATGERGAASTTGWYGAASATGGCSIAAVTGEDGRAMTGEGGVINLAWFNPVTRKYQMKCAEVGTNGLEPNIWYQLDKNGRFTPV